ncbi:putative RNA methyltransferase [Glycomyces algeriensis]|uniref:Ubiquinone biosynthesis protein n=1 Tax=Glycomyces algeriensis TaxID=256037 RepID=A0A9W6G8B6_9ACTN|nr:methyltransferase domain-containing protein [Glycomyces algeriensis]MDA1367989.1 methyltransferase domain-containing protein [Glycomyces algeriensis]MDR7349528.1 23S rRNA (guanine745-N1)-methyltransferase [Glycomyces algeriensis]GLI42235.1 ubiquinone biosynthesis protein [Glycomyces algeriensis]
MTDSPVTLPALDALACPNCAGPLTQADRRLSCPDGHSFDLAKQGYAPLLAPGSNTTTGDTADQIAAREDFLDSGVYDPLMAAVATASLTDAPGVFVEPGCGTGHYLAVALAADPSREGIGLDTSKYALRRCAKRTVPGSEPGAGPRPRIAAVLADAWQRLPIRDGAAAAVLNVFAPRNAEEIARVLDPQGALVVLTPRQDHLRELVGTLDMLSVDPEKEQRTADQLGTLFEAERTDEVVYSIDLGHNEVLRLVGMGPSARHLDAAALAATVAALPERIEVQVAANVTRWRKKH